MPMLGVGTTLGYSTTENGSYTNLSQVVGLPAPGQKRDSVEFTNLDSDDCHEWFAGLLEPGEYSFECIYTKARLAVIYGLGSTTYWWKITYPDGGYHKFQGYVTGYGAGAEAADKIKVMTGIKCTGNPTFTAA